MSGKYGTPMTLAKVPKRQMGKRKALARQAAKWAAKSGEVKVGRIEDLPEDHPARQA